MRRAATISLLGLCLWAWSSPNANACDCVGPGTACSALTRADAVFVGRVTSLASGVQFDVERAVSGIARGQVTLGNGPGNCALGFTIGERYVVYAYRDQSTGALYTGLCTRTRPLSDPHTRGDIAYFDRRQQPAAAGGLLTGVVSDVTPDLKSTVFALRPLGGIQVSASPLDGGKRRTTATRADGSYELRGVPANSMLVAASLPARFEAHQPVMVNIAETNACAEADVYARVDGRIRGQLLDEGGRPARGVDLQLADADNARARIAPLRTLNAITDEEGMFEFRYVGFGRYVVGVGLQSAVRPGKLDRRRFYDLTQDPTAATVVVLRTAERRQLPPFRMAPLPADRVISVVLRAPTQEVAGSTGVFLTGATREPVVHDSLPLTLRLPFGAAYLLEATAPKGYQIIQPRQIRIDRDDTDRTIEFRVER